MLFELMRIGGSPRYCPELAGVRARFFTYKDCEPKMVLQLGAAPSTCRLSTGCSTGELQEVKLVVRLGTAPSLPS